MISEKVTCPFCNDYIQEVDDLISPSVLVDTVVCLFCKRCGHGFEVTESEGMFLLRDIQAED